MNSVPMPPVLRRSFAFFASIFVLALSLALFAWPAMARTGNPTPKEFLESIYRNYVGSANKDAPGVPIKSAAEVKAYFTQGLASLILDGQGDDKSAGVPELNGDPFVGRPNWEIDDLSVEVQEKGPVKAKGIVSFINTGKPEKVVLELLKVGNDWRIADVQWDTGTLRGLFLKR